MNKTIENIKNGNYSVVDNQGVSVTEHFVNCLEQEFADLEAKLAEKEEEIETLNNKILISQLQAPKEQILNILGSQCIQYNPNQLTELENQLTELEKAKDYYQGLYFNAIKKQERTNKVVKQFQQRVKYFSDTTKKKKFLKGTKND